MDAKTLILTKDYAPHKIVTGNRALMMLFQGKIRVVEEYAGTEHVMGKIEVARQSEFKNVVQALGTRAEIGKDLLIRLPSVASLIRGVGSVKRGVKFSRINVFTRDGFRCQYCGDRKKMAELNYDHVLPRRLGGKTNWDNIVAACYACNSFKADRTPEQAGMRLRKRPYKPKTLPMLGPRFDFKEVPVTWLPYCASYFGEDETAVA